MELKLPTGAKASLEPYEAKGKGKGKKGHALLDTRTGGFNGFGVTTVAMAKHLPAFVEIDGTRVQLLEGKNPKGKPRVMAQNAPLPNGLVAVVRIVDLQTTDDEGTALWNYVVEVGPAPKKPEGFGKPKVAPNPFS